MTDTRTRTDLPSREEIVERFAQGAHAHYVLDSLTLLDLAAEMQRRGAFVAIGAPAHEGWDRRLLTIRGRIPDDTGG